MYLNQDEYAAGGMNSAKSKGQSLCYSSKKKTSLLLKTSVGTWSDGKFSRFALLEIALTTGSFAKYRFVDVSNPAETTSYCNFPMFALTEVESNTALITFIFDTFQSS